MTIYIVYKTDNWHSHASRDIIGLGTSINASIRLCKLQAAKEHEKIDAQQLWNLQNLKQTQGYSGEGEFHFETTVETNTLL